MVAITLDNISKRFGANTVIREFTADIEDKEFLVLLGPSGCGKSTMLRMIAGLTEISGGQLQFGGKTVNDLGPKQRNIAFVFQSYALYPHMTVRDNIAFPLVMDQYSWWFHLPVVGGVGRRQLAKRADISGKVEKAAEMLELSDYLDRRPKALSGGQRQRVAVARSIVREPDIYLFDEPLSNLDAKLRMQMRAEISALHARVGKTFVYVTHDQVEAMTMGTKIAVLNEGVVQQFGAPSEIYDTPANVFVARFIGSPPMNIFPVEIERGKLYVDNNELRGAEELMVRMEAMGLKRVDLGVRAESISVAEDSGVSLEAHVIASEQLGAESVIGMKFGPAGTSTEVGAAASRHLHYARVPGSHDYETGSEVTFSFRVGDAHFFDPETGVRIDG